MFHFPTQINDPRGSGSGIDENTVFKWIPIDSVNASITCALAQDGRSFCAPLLTVPEEAVYNNDPMTVQLNPLLVHLATMAGVWVFVNGY